jgi:hypothetical protein
MLLFDFHVHVSRLARVESVDPGLRLGDFE